MAEIYVAKAEGIGGFEKLIAIKVIHPQYSQDEQFIQMLIDEAKLSVRLTHANIAQTFDLGCIDDTYYIAMEYIEGADVYRMLSRANAEGRRLPIDVCVHIVRELCHGLAYAHRKHDEAGNPLHIVHRDVSPQNILVSLAGEVKVLDFGIAKAAQRSGQTEAGVIKGKYFYMSPEQAWADPLDGRSDLFCAGLVLHEALTGDLVYQGDNLPELIDRVRRAEIAPPSRKRPDIPPQLDEIVMRALAKQPVDRWNDAEEMATALGRFLQRTAPSFGAGRVAAVMAELFPDDSSEVSLVSGDRLLESRSTHELSLSTGSLERMHSDEFQPDPSKSVIFDIEEPTRVGKRSMMFDDESTSTEVPRAKRPGFPPNEPDSWGEEATTVDSSAVLRDLLSRPEQAIPAPSANRPVFPPQSVAADQRPDLTSLDAPAESSYPASPFDSSPFDSSPFESPWPSGGPRIPPPPAIPSRVGPDSGSHNPWPIVPAQTAESTAHTGGGLPDLSWRDNSDAFVAQPHVPITMPAPRRPWRLLLLLLCGGIIGGGVLAYVLSQAVEAAVPEIEVVTVPPGASVDVDGVTQVGVTPLTLAGPFSPGTQVELRVRLDGHEPWRRSFEAHPGPSRQIVVLTPVPLELRVQSVPAGAQIRMDGIDIGETPLTIPSLPFGRTVRLDAQLEGHQSLEQDVQVGAHEGDVVFTLAPLAP